MPDLPSDLIDRLRTICLGLPEAHEQPAWTGVRWRVRTRTFAHALTVGPGGDSAYMRAFATKVETTCVTFRAPGDELEALRSTGHPFFRVDWGRDVVGMALGPGTDWSEVAELLTDSFCLLAPHKLVARVVRPPTH